MTNKLLLFAVCLFRFTISYGQFHQFETFIPSNFTLLDSASGDINQDGLTDLVLILRDTAEKRDTATNRPLLLLQGNGKRLYRLIGRNDSVVLCLNCGGIWGDPYEGITIKKGYFSIEHMGGSNWRWTRIITFKFDVKRKRFVLHRDAGYSWWTLKSGHEEDIVTSKKDFDKLPFDNYRYEKNPNDR